MKKAIILTLVISLLLMTFSFVACDKKSKEEVYENTIPYQLIHCDKIDADYNNWNGKAIITSKDELKAFTDARSYYTYSSKSTNKLPYTAYFTDIDNYNDDYFSSKAIVVYCFAASSGSFEYEIKALQNINNNIILNIHNTFKGGECTDDEAYWQVLLEIDNEQVKDNPELVINYIR